MSDASNIAKSLRERLSENTEERLGKALSDLLENPLITGAIGRAFDAREKASQAQEVAMGALNIPSAADIERLTRRLRAVSHRLEGIEDGVHRLDRALSPGAVEARLSTIEQQLGKLTDKLMPEGRRPARAAAAAKPTRSKVKPTKAKRTSKAKAASKTKAASKVKAASKGKATRAKESREQNESRESESGKQSQSREQSESGGQSQSDARQSQSGKQIQSRKQSQSDTPQSQTRERSQRQSAEILSDAAGASPR